MPEIELTHPSGRTVVVEVDRIPSDMDASTDTGKVSIRPYSQFAASRQKFHKFIRPKKK